MQRATLFHVTLGWETRIMNVRILILVALTFAMVVAFNARFQEHVNRLTTRLQRRQKCRSPDQWK